MTRDELLTLLLVERFAPIPAPAPDAGLAQRRQLLHDIAREVCPLEPVADEVDEIAVERAMRGDRSVLPDLTPLERRTVAERILCAGGSRTDVARALAMSGATVNAFLARVAS